MPGVPGRFLFFFKGGGLIILWLDPWSIGFWENPFGIVSSAMFSSIRSLLFSLVDVISLTEFGIKDTKKRKEKDKLAHQERTVFRWWYIYVIKRENPRVNGGIIYIWFQPYNEEKWPNMLNARLDLSLSLLLCFYSHFNYLIFRRNIILICWGRRWKV